MHTLTQVDHPWSIPFRYLARRREFKMATPRRSSKYVYVHRRICNGEYTPVFYSLLTAGILLAIVDNIEMD